MVSEIIFPFFDIMVNTIFGSIGLSLAALAVIIVVMLAFCRCSWVFILYWMMFYVMVTFTFYIGALGIVIFMILSLIYLFTQMLRYFAPDR